MIGPCACRSLYWNSSPAGEDELAGTIPIESSDTPTPTLVVSRALIPAPAAALAPLFASAATNLAAKYLAKDLQGILKTILKARALTPQPKGPQRPKPWIYTAISLIWGVIISAKSLKTILLPPVPQDWTTYFLLPHSSKTKPYSTGSNININAS